MIQLTPNAAKAIRRFIKFSETPVKAFRISVVDGGCNGVQYNLSLEAAADADDIGMEVDGNSMLVEPASRTMLEALWAMGASVSAYDPAAMEETRRIYGERADLLLVDSPMDALKGADALLIVTEWKVFRSPNFDTMKSLLKTPLVFDGRNLYEPQAMREMGFDYLPIGRQ